MPIVRLVEDAPGPINIALPSGRVLSVAPGNQASVLERDLGAVTEISAFLEVADGDTFRSLATPAPEPEPEPEEPEGP